MATTLQERIAAALSTVTDPKSGEGVLEARVVRNVATTLDGKVAMTVVLEAGVPAEIVRDVRQVVEQVEGVVSVAIDVQDPPAATAGGPSQKARSLPVVDQRPAAPARPAAQQPVAFPHLGHMIAVSSGKGGVGKSTVAVNLAVALAARGLRVGLMDADIYGPNIPRMMGVSAAPAVRGERIIPLEAHGVKLISLGLLIEREQPAIWRGPIVMKIVNQFLRDVAWGELDYFLVDMPPGTGDAQLSLVQAAHLSGAVIVTTPQHVSTGDALRGAMMFQRVGVPVLGIVENMSWFECPHCGKPTALFGSGGGHALASELQLDLLAQIPLYVGVMEGGDGGTPIVVSDPGAAAARALTGLADRLHATLAAPAR